MKSKNACTAARNRCLLSVVVRSAWRLAATSRSSGKAFRRAGVEHVTLNDQGQILRVEVSDT